MVSDSSSRHRLKLAMLACGIAAFSLLYCTQALLPAIGAAFGVGPALTSLTVSCVTGALALTLLPFSSLAESVGRVRMMRAGLIAACALTLLAAAMPAFWMLLAARALVGVALAAVVAVAMGHIGDEAGPEGIGPAMGVYVAGITLGGLLARLVPGVAEEFGSWRVSVVALAACAAVAIAAFVVLLPPARRFEPAPARFAVHARGLRELWADHGIRRLCAVGFLLMGGFVGVYNYLGYHLMEAPIGLTPTLASLLFLAYLAGTVSSAVTARLVDRFGRTRSMAGAILLSLAGLALTLPHRLDCIAVGLVLFTGGFFAAHSIASTWVALRAPRRRGQAASLYLLAYYGGSSLVGTALGLAYHHGGWPVAAAAVAALSLTALGIAGDIERAPRTRRAAGAARVPRIPPRAPWGQPWPGA